MLSAKEEMDATIDPCRELIFELARRRGLIFEKLDSRGGTSGFRTIVKGEDASMSDAGLSNLPPDLDIFDDGKLDAGSDTARSGVSVSLAVLNDFASDSLRGCSTKPLHDLKDCSSEDLGE
jgi:hypothetical protein